MCAMTLPIWQRYRMLCSLGKQMMVIEEEVMSTKPQHNTYDQFADAYAQSYAQPSSSGVEFIRDLVIPRLLEIAGDVDGLTVLDAGCGEGILSRSLVGRATKIVGIDIVPQLIAYARQRDQTQRIIYEVHDLSSPLPKYTNTFDLVVSNLVLNDVPDYSGFITTLSDLLKPGGRIVLSMNNPYSALLREKVQNYFDSDAVAQYGFGPALYFHRTMEEYCRAFQHAGLLLRCLYDVQMTEEIVAHLPEKNKTFPWYPYYHRFPFMLILDLVKATRQSSEAMSH
jgi:2-polyprenyl-3-methyl-5-hydroxy-6-metoxy-1,4-benzoquinol methylase